MTEPSPPPTPRQIARQLNRARAGQAVKFTSKQSVAQDINSKQAARAKAPRTASDWNSTEAPAAYNGNFSVQMPPLNVTKGDVARFIFMPQIGNSLKSVGFSLAVIMQIFAVILIAAKLLPADHPARTLDGAKRYHLLNLLGEARRNLTFTRAALPQWAMFTSVCGFIISFASILMLMLAKFGFGVALAQPAPTGTEGIGTGPAPSVFDNSVLAGSQDMGSNILNSIFNLDNTSNVMPGINLMLKMYSTTMLIFAGIILLWIIISTIADTARTGVPFGKHFNPVWAPIRLVVAIALLVPLGSGLNSGQHIVLSLAKWGSGQATQIWKEFASKINTGQGVVSNGYTSTKSVYNNIVVQEILSQVAERINARAALVTDAAQITAEVGQANGVTTASGENLNSITVKRENKFSQTGNFSTYPNLNAGSFTQHTTNEQALPFKNGTVQTYLKPDGSNVLTPAQASEAIYADRYNGLRAIRLKLKFEPSYRDLIEDIVTQVSDYDASGRQYTSANPKRYVYATTNGASISSVTWKKELHSLQDYYWDQQNAVADYRKSQYTDKLSQQIEKDMSKAGWIAAPIWINAIARENAYFLNASGTFPVFTLPTPTNWPSVTPDTPAGKYYQAIDVMKNLAPNDISAAFIQTNSSDLDAGQLTSLLLNNGKPMENPLEYLTTMGRYAINVGIKIKLNIEKRTDTELDVEKKMQEYAPQYNQNMVTQTLNSHVNSTLKNDELKNILMPLLIFGFLLGYMLPLMPFFRFVLGVLGWLLLVFEALLAMPLFALAHLKTDGEGFMSQMAQSGYIMILGLVIRPILMICGLVVGLICFNAIAQLTSVLFTYAITSPLSNSSGTISQGGDLASLVINMLLYASFLITLANSSFKAIDLIPNHVMGWLGSRMDSRVDDSSMVQQTAMSGLYAAGGALNMAMTGGGLAPNSMQQNSGGTPSNTSHGSGAGSGTGAGSNNKIPEPSGGQSMPGG